MSPTDECDINSVMGRKPAGLEATKKLDVWVDSMT